MARKAKTAAPFSSLDAWHTAHPREAPSSKEYFAAIPVAVQQQLSTKMTHSGAEALAVWQMVSVQLQVFQQSFNAVSLQNDPKQYFANVGFFTTLASLFEDRLNALYVARSKMVFGAAYSEATDSHASVTHKAQFLRDYDDIAGHDRQAIIEYAKWRNAIAHQAHYNSGILCTEVFAAMHALFEDMQRMRNRQKTVLRNELKHFPTLEAQQDAAQALAVSLTGATNRAFLHSQLGVGAGVRVPFRHGAPVFVVKTPGTTRITLVDRIATHAVAWQTLHGKQWQVPIFEQRAALGYSGVHAVTLHVAGGRVELAC